MELKIDKELCIGCGLCTSICKDVFRLGADGKSEIIPDVDLAKHADHIDQAAASCPVSAIIYKE
ncbi:MAG: ferredoxin [Patescibacteria group bacterium]|nr:ferredoxin [Patescibacteria group bacterium]